MTVSEVVTLTFFCGIVLLTIVLEVHSRWR